MRPDGNTPQPLRVVVSGGIGSGKSTVLGLFHNYGAVIIEADRIGHEVLEPGGDCFKTVAERWPSVVVYGRIDRRRLAAIVFSDVEQLAELETITHPAIRDGIAARVAAAADDDIVLELPIQSDLAGPGWTKIVVDAPEHVRLARSIERGMESADVERRIEAQPDRDVLLTGADIVVDNTGTIESLEEQARQVWEMLQASAATD